MKKMLSAVVILILLALFVAAAAEGSRTAPGERPPAQMQEDRQRGGGPMGQPHEGMPSDQEKGRENLDEASDGKGIKPEEQMPGRIDFDAMVTKGILSQETCDRIKAYMEEHKPADLPEMNGEEPAELPPLDAQAQAGEKPAELPERTDEAPSRSEVPEMDGLLADLLKEGIITQAEYDAMTAQS